MKFLLIIISIISLTAGFASSSIPKYADANPRYRPGDWVSYGVTHFMSSVAIGPNEVYFGTTSGILRYDIFQESWRTPYTTSDGLSDNKIRSVAYDSFSGFLWCATDQGVSRQHPASQRWTNYSKIEMGLFFSDDIISIGFDSETNWFETQTGKLIHQDKFGDLFIPGTKNNTDEQLLIKWFGWRAIPQDPLPHFFMPAGYLFNPATSIETNSFFRTLGSVQDNRLRQASVTSVIDDSWGNLWMGTWGLGALKADINNVRADVLRFGLANERVDALLFEGDNLWIGGVHSRFTFPFDESIQGITQWESPQLNYSPGNDWEYFDARYNIDMSSDEVNNFAFDDNKLYCATEVGLNIYDKSKRRWQRILPWNGLVDERVNDVLIYGDGIFAATDLGLNYISLETIGEDSLEIIEINPDELRHIQIYDLELQQNLLWLATEQGPFIYNLTTDESGYLADNEGPRDEITHSISFSDSVIWLGTDSGIDAFDVIHKRWLPTPARRIMPGIGINCVKADTDAVWVGTNRGVYKYHRRLQQWQHYTTSDGLLDNHVNAIALDGNIVWFGTDLGLTAFQWRVYHDFD